MHSNVNIIINTLKIAIKLQVESEDSYERIGGTATGGGTFWGLGSLLTKAKVFYIVVLYY